MSNETAPPSIPPRHRPSGPVSRPAMVGGLPEPGVPPSSSLRPAGSDPVDESSTPGAAFTPLRGRGPAVVRPSGSPTSSRQPIAGDVGDGPSPMQVAVDSVTATIKKAAAATSAAIGSATRPRAEEHPSARASTGAAPRTGPGAGFAGAAATQPTAGRMPIASADGAPRRVRLAVSRVDPWSVMKLSFLLSVALGIVFVVAVAVVWFALDGMKVFTQVDTLIRQVLGAENVIDVLQYVSFSRVISAATLVAVVDVFLLTALSTIAAFLYNITASLVGGVHLTLTDE